MSEQDPTSDAARRTLSEISHLFLSDVRDRHTGGMARPQRIPPGGRVATAVAASATPAIARAEPRAPGRGPVPTVAPVPPVTAVLGAHLGEGQFDRARQYARHLAGRVGRVGLIEIDGWELRLLCFEPKPDLCADGLGDDPAAPQAAAEVDVHDVHDARRVGEAIEEMSCDVRRWLLFVSQPRKPEAQALLADVGHWTLLSTCDHDGVVSSYRMLKGLSDAPRGRRPRLTLSLLDTDNESEMVRVFRKLAGVAEQFLGWPVEPEPSVQPAPAVTEHCVLVFRAAEAADGVAPEPHWAVVGDLIARANAATAATAGTVASAVASPTPSRPAPIDSANAATVDVLPDEGGEMSEQVPALSPAAPTEEPAMNASRPRITPPAVSMRLAADTGSEAEPEAAAVSESGAGAGPGPSADSEVLDLSGPDVSVEAILNAILGRRDGGLVECPVRAPMCSAARLAIGRDRRVVLLAVAREGLSELRSIGQAYRWLIENRGLIGMAVPQLAIDAHQAPRLRLLVDWADVSADLLRPILHSGHVTVQAYRKIRWGGRMGLLLDAA